jgi:hypothetical protein
MRVRNNGTHAAEIPAKQLADEAPLYSPKAVAPSRPAAIDWESILQSIITKRSANYA